jgi:hypothetical protein
VPPPPNKIYTAKLAKEFQILAKSANLHYKKQLPNYFVKKQNKIYWGGGKKKRKKNHCM